MDDRTLAERLARVTDLEAKLETLQALVSREARKSEELRKDNEILKRDSKIFYEALNRASSEINRLEDNAQALYKKHENTWELCCLNEELGQILNNRDKLHSKNIDVLRSLSDLHQLQIERLLDAYYHVFPERVNQDYEFQRQMDKIEEAAKANPSPDADPKKS